LQFLFVLDPLDSLKAYKDSSVAMMRAAQARGHAVWVSQPARLHWTKNRVDSSALRISLTDNDEDWFRPHEAETRALKDFDAVLMRKDPPFDLEYVTLDLVFFPPRRATARACSTRRTPSATTTRSSRSRSFRSSRCPPLATRDMAGLQAFIDEQRDVILKRLEGMGGAGIFRVRHDDPNRNVIVETVSELGGRAVMAQRYIPEIAQGDKRVLLIDGEPVPHCLARIPKPGETRGNLAAGARGVAQPLSPRHREIAAAIGPVLSKRNLLLVGLDVIGDWLTEVNVTSPTCFREIQDQTGFDVSGMFLDALEKKIGKL